MTGAVRLFVATPLAVLISSLVITIELSLANNPISELLKPSNWDGGLRFTLVAALYIIPLGLVPGLLLHALFVRLNWRELWQYLLAALLFGASWSTAFHQWMGVGDAFMGGIVAAAVLGTATFWVLRRPDRIASHAAAT